MERSTIFYSIKICYESTDEMVESAMEIAKTEFNLNKGDLIVVTGGFPMGEARRTNYLRIVEI